MRKIVAISALSVLAAGSIAVGAFQTRGSSEPMTADLERDLSLATSVQPTRSAVVSAIEQGRNGAPSGEAKGQRMVVPTKKRAPSRAPSPTVTEVAAVAPDVNPEPAPTAPPEVAPPTVSAAPTPVEATTTVAAVPDNSYPTPAPSTGGPSAGTGNEGERGNVGNGSGDNGHRGAGVVGVIGAILRGGTAGVDNCEPNGRRRGGTIGAIGGVMRGSGMPTGSIPGGPRSGGRRW